MMERVLEFGEQAYSNMQAMANMLTAFSPCGFEYQVEDTYFDYGQDWKWTTIIRKHDPLADIWDGVQVLNPKEWRMVVSAQSPQDLAKAYDEIVNNKFWNDRRYADGK